MKFFQSQRQEKYRTMKSIDKGAVQRMLHSIKRSIFRTHLLLNSCFKNSRWSYCSECTTEPAELIEEEALHDFLDLKARKGESFGYRDGREAYKCVLGQMHH